MTYRIPSIPFSSSVETKLLYQIRPKEEPEGGTATAEVPSRQQLSNLTGFESTKFA